MAAAPVFKKIADCVVAFDEELGSVDLQDSGRVMRPVLTKGRRAGLQAAHNLLGLPFAQPDSARFTEWTVYDPGKGLYVDYDVPQGRVPDCHGMTVRDAMALLRAAGMRVRFTGQGKVVSQSPAARTAARKGTTVTLELQKSEIRLTH
jgi:cell division protein FtsI (penicillin-binding protein 3)